MEDNGFPEQLVSESMEKLRKCLVRVAKGLADKGPFLMGVQYTIADIVLIPSVVRMQDLGLNRLWQDLPAIQAWFDTVQSRPSFDIAYVRGSRVNPANYQLSQGMDA
jgi:glutathione S-transferase